MKRLGIALIALVVVPGSNEARAQSAPLAMGARVRVRAADIGVTGSTGTHAAGLVGRLYRAGADSLWLRVDAPDGPLLSIDRASIRGLEISNGRKRNPGKGALWGAGAGLGLGLLAVATLDDCTVSTRNWSFDFCSGNEDVLILGDVLAGATIGALVGLLITTERWVAVPPASLTLVNAGAGTGLALRLRLPL